MGIWSMGLPDSLPSSIENARIVRKLEGYTDGLILSIKDVHIKYAGAEYANPLCEENMMRTLVRVTAAGPN